MTIQKRPIKVKENISGWDQAIAEAKNKISALRFTIKVYKDRRKRGEPWPGDKSIQSPSQ
jgi:hypothetical protein